MWRWRASQLDRIERKVDALLRGQGAMAVDFTAMQAELERNTSVDASIQQLVLLLAAKIEELKQGADPATQAKIDELVTSLRAQNDALAAFTVANTPAA